MSKVISDKNCEYASVDKDNDPPKELGLGVRHVQALLMFLCLTFGYGMRVTMSVAIVAMTDKSTAEDSGITTFDWNKKVQDLILSSFFWGYTCMQIPGGHLAHKYGAKHLMVFALTTNGLIAITLPWAARFAGWQAVCACRTLQGLCQGSLLPSLHTLQGKWSPVNERGRLSTYIYGGSMFGTVLVMPMSGVLAASSYGWPLIFYCAGAVNIFVGLVWFWYGAESPAVHKSISKEERDYIQISLGQQNKQKPMKVPWSKILTCVPMWGMAIAHMGSAWVQLTLFTEIPSYLNKVMKVNLKANGVLSALPFLGMWLASFIYSYLSDYFINRQVCSLTAARKIANTIAVWGASVILIILSFVPETNMPLAVTLLVITTSIKSGVMVGFHVNHIDVAPNFAGTMMGICNMTSNLFGIMAPITAGLVLKDEHDVLQWRKVFWISAGVAFTSNLVYIIIGSAKEVTWNDPEYLDSNKGIEMSDKKAEKQSFKT